jgi:hypothetical protein
MVAGDRFHVPHDDAEGLHSYADILRRLKAAIALAAARTRVAPNCRVAQWMEAISRLSGADPRSVLAQMVPNLRQGSWHHPFKDSFRALVDSRMFTLIVEQLLPDLRDSDVRDLVSGNFDPARDKPGKRARDREFELFVAAVARRAGLAVRLGEPDIILDVQASQWCIAAKRLSSSKRVRHNVDKAARQIFDAGRPGFVFLDVTRILDPTYVACTHWRGAHQTVGGRLLHFANTKHKETLTTRRNEYVRGVVLRAAFPHVSEGLSYGTYETWKAVPVSGVEGSEVNSLLRELLGGLQNS